MAALYQFEAVAFGYFTALAAAAALSRAPRHARFRTAGASMAMAAVVAAMALAPAPPVWRGWIAHAYLVAAYWIPAWLVTGGPSEALERWFIRADAVLPAFRLRTPVWLASVLELLYLSVYPFVPIAFAILWVIEGTSAIDRFWTPVLLAGCVCYGSLPWLTARPPRARTASNGPTGPGRRVPLRHFNVSLLARVSHGFNTFPSGHVAVSVAAALAVLAVSPPAGSVLLLVAAGIAVGAVVGEYHYVTDVVVGVVVGALAASLHQLWAAAL